MITISQAQQNYIDYLKHRLSHCDIYGDRVMDSVVQRTSLTFESRGYRDLDINDLQDKADALKKQIENVRKQRQASSDSDERDRLERELGRMQNCLANINSLITNEGREPLLGLYAPYAKSITLFVDNIYDTAEYILKCQKGAYGLHKANRGLSLQYILECLTGYVFVHEMFHAYYDMGCMSIREIEEAMAEYGSLSFLLSIHEFDTLEIAIKEVQAKQYSGVWTSAYGFGKYIFDCCNLRGIGAIHLMPEDFVKYIIDCKSHASLVYFYRAAKTSVLRRKQLTAKFTKGFSSGYPFGSEHKYLNLLYIIINKSLIDLAPLMNAIKKVVSNHSQSIHSVNDIKDMFPKQLMSTPRGTGRIIYDPHDIIKYRTCKASVNGIDYEIHFDKQGWKDHKEPFEKHIRQNPHNIFTAAEQHDLLTAIIKSGI